MDPKVGAIVYHEIRASSKQFIMLTFLLKNEVLKLKTD